MARKVGRAGLQSALSGLFLTVAATDEHLYSSTFVGSGLNLNKDNERANLEEILTDHAFCEQKAASTAISLIVSFPEYTDVVQEMTALVEEEMSHFKMVHDLILDYGYTLGRDRKDEYVHQLLKFFPKGGSRTTQLVHRLLYAALSAAKLSVTLIVQLPLREDPNKPFIDSTDE